MIIINNYCTGTIKKKCLKKCSFIALSPGEKIFAGRFKASSPALNTWEKPSGAEPQARQLVTIREAKHRLHRATQHSRPM